MTEKKNPSSESRIMEKGKTEYRISCEFGNLEFEKLFADYIIEKIQNQHQNDRAA